MMEVAAAKVLWGRSLEYKFRYTTMVGDGDCKTHNELTAMAPYGGHPVAKEESISHFSKRLGTALRKVTTAAKTDGVTIGGVRQGSLTQNKMVIMQKYFTKAILNNPRSVESMRRAIWAIFYHAQSTDEFPQHQFCPTGSDSWCPYQKAVSQNLPPPPHTSSIAINERVASYVKPTFDKLTSDQILKRCLQGRIQNPNESVHSDIWNYIPKCRFVGATRIRLGVFLGTSQFNSGSLSLHHLMKEVGLVIPPVTLSLSLGSTRDLERIYQAEKSSLQETKRRKEVRRQANVQLQATLEEAEGGPAYAPGAF